RRRHTRFSRDWSSDVCSSDLERMRRSPQRGLDYGRRLCRWEGWHTVLQQRQFNGDIQRNQIAASRQNLTEFDEDGAQRFERPAQPHAARRARRPTETEHLEQRIGKWMADARHHQLIEPVAQYDYQDVAQAQQRKHAQPPARSVGTVANRRSRASRRLSMAAFRLRKVSMAARVAMSLPSSPRYSATFPASRCPAACAAPATERPPCNRRGPRT